MCFSVCASEPREAGSGDPEQHSRAHQRAHAAGAPHQPGGNFPGGHGGEPHAGHAVLKYTLPEAAHLVNLNMSHDVYLSFISML